MRSPDFGLMDDHPVDFFDSPVAVPSMNIVGERDAMKPLSVKLSKRFLRPEMVYHTGDHRPLPSKPNDRLRLLAQIEAFVVAATTTTTPGPGQVLLGAP